MKITGLAGFLVAAASLAMVQGKEGLLYTVHVNIIILLTIQQTLYWMFSFLSSKTTRFW